MDNSELIAAIQGQTKNMDASEKQALEFVLSSSNDFANTLDAEAQKKRVAAKKVAEAKAVKDKEEAAAKLKNSLSTDQFLLSDMTGGVLPKSGIDHVMFRYPEGTWDAEHSINIPEVDPFFVWDADLLDGLWMAYLDDEKALAVGPPGTGKSTASRQLAAWIRQPFARFNGKDGIEGAAFLGYAWATSAGMEWKDGLMPQAVEHGYYTCIDEVMKLPPGIQMAMQSLYEKDGFLMLDEKPGTIAEKHIHPRPEFRLIGTDNSKGTGDDMDKYGASQMQDISTLDRFTITLPVTYLTVAQECGMLEKRYPNCEVKVIKRSVVMAKLVREAFDNGDLALTLSPRGLNTVCQLTQRGLSLETAIRMAYINKLGDDIERKAAEGFLGSAI